MIDSDPLVVRVYCDDESHAPKVVTVDHIGRSAKSGRVVSFGINLMQGPSTHPDWLGEQLSHANMQRDRLPLECPLCGLKCVLQQETASTLLDGLLHAGAGSLNLAALAATLRG